MSIPVLIQVYDEVRRLAIAGGAVAAGDFRLKKLVAPLEKSGEKAPVFGKVAAAVQAVVDSNDKTASAALLELTTLVNAVLYTQGETGIAGEFKPLETNDLSGLGAASTQAGARTLKPLLEALGSTGSGRLELVRDAFERGAFKDLRLVKPALRAIDDPYAEIGDFIAEKVLPLYGKAILPELRATLDIKGRGGHLHRLRLLHRLDPEGSRDDVQRALNDGSKEMKVAAVECLDANGGDLVYLLEQSKAKARDVRAAALRALAATGTANAAVMATLKKAISGADLALIITRVRECLLPELQDFTLQQAEEQLTELLDLKDKKLQGPAVTRLQQLVSCLADRTDASAEAFLLRCFDSGPALAGIKSEPSGTDLNELVAHVLSRGTPGMRKGLVAAQQTLSGSALSSAIFAARAMMTSAAFYDEFSPVLNGLSDKHGKKSSPDQERAAALLRALTSDGDNYFYRHWMGVAPLVGPRSDTPLPALDPRWLDAAVNSGSVELVCELARSGHEGVNRFLNEKLEQLKKPQDAHGILQTMVRIGHPRAADALVDAMTKRAKETTYYYFNYWYGPMIADLPRGALPKIEAMLPALPDKVVDQLMESVLALRNKPD
ncbi:MAG TPA: hypothetical protein VF624_02770 [Tepidisphaeraceae bacterium]|jgi:hypothetical protein